MKFDSMKMKKAWACALLLAPTFTYAFESGSTGADGEFKPTVNTVLEVPPSGVFNFTTVDIPAGVTVTFKKNATNTPVVVLASGNVTVAGALNLSGGSSTPVGAAGNGNLGDDGIPGAGGPGGYDGGRGGEAPSLASGTGLGPGGGGNGAYSTWIGGPGGGGGGGYNSSGASSQCGSHSSCQLTGRGLGGASYGSSLLLPLIGGSGGGGAGGVTFSGSGGGGGGGAILLASSGTVSITGAVVANGGNSGSSAGSGYGATGGGGSGGAIRIIASAIGGNGTISAAGGGVGSTPDYWRGGGSGAAGRIRLEADTITRTAGTNPGYTTGAPGPIFVSGMPTLRIASVAGVNAPESPTGNADITLPSTTTNPVTVVFQTNNVPVGNTVKLTLTPASGATTTVVSPALDGTTENASASVSIALPSGPSVLQAQTTYTIVAALGDMLQNYAGNERVEKIELTAGLNGKSVTNLITVSGKRYEASDEALAMLSRIPAFMAQGS
jgi:hypothetical protein